MMSSRKNTRRKRKKAPRLEDYEVYLERAGGKEECQICGAKPKTRRLDRDHDHKTNEGRGILCHKCNRSLPYWVDSDWLEKAADYLRRDEVEKRGRKP